MCQGVHSGAPFWDFPWPGMVMIVGYWLALCSVHSQACPCARQCAPPRARPLQVAASHDLKNWTPVATQGLLFQFDATNAPANTRLELAPRVGGLQATAEFAQTAAAVVDAAVLGGVALWLVRPLGTKR